MKLDEDLQSIQEARDLLKSAKQAQAIVEEMSQDEIDRIVESMAQTAEHAAEHLASLAVEETGYGNQIDKKVKNLFAARDVFQAIRELKTVGIISRDEQHKVWEVAQPVGIIAGIIPSTNPTSTVIFKALIAVKARNAIVFSPHPAAMRCTAEAAKYMQRAAEQAGAPQGLISCLTKPTMAASQELMSHKLTDLILATGGTSMVKAAYSSGKPAYGVGPGNVPVYIHESAEILEAVRLILASKTFDYGTICASEQALVVDRAVKKPLIAELIRQGAYFLNDLEKQKLASILMVNNGLNPRVVGKAPQIIAQLAGFTIPSEIKVLVAEEEQIGRAHPLSIEKLSPILALYTVNDWQEGCQVCMKLLQLGGLGHTLGLYCRDKAVIESFGLKKPASRIVVNSGTTFGAIGSSTGIFPSLTLGCGSFGNNITTDNIGPQHLLNIKRIAFHIKEVNTERKQEVLTETDTSTESIQPLSISKEEITEIVQRIIREHQLKS